MITALVVLASASLSSFLSGLLGIGGALILTPLLLYGPQVFGEPALDVKLVTGLTMVQALSGSLFAARRHGSYGYVSWPVVRAMGPTMAIASLAGALVSGATPNRVLLGAFAALALIGSGALLIPPRAVEPRESGHAVEQPAAAATAAGLGFVSGLVGIGGIWLVVPGLMHLQRLAARVAIGTGLAIGFFGALAGVIGKAATAQIDLTLGVLVFAAGAFIAPVGAAASVRAQPRALTIALAVLVAAAALRVAWSAMIEGS